MVSLASTPRRHVTRWLDVLADGTALGAYVYNGELVGDATREIWYHERSRASGPWAWVRTSTGSRLVVTTPSTGEASLASVAAGSTGVVAARRTSPSIDTGSDGGTVIGPDSMGTLNFDRTQNFVNGHCDSTAGLAVAVWEYGNSRMDGGKVARGASLDLTDPSAAWIPFTDPLSSEPDTEVATLPTVWVNADGTFLVAYVWEGAEQAVRLRVGLPS